MAALLSEFIAPNHPSLVAKPHPHQSSLSLAGPYLLCQAHFWLGQSLLVLVPISSATTTSLKRSLFLGLIDRKGSAVKARTVHL